MAYITDFRCTKCHEEVKGTPPVCNDCSRKEVEQKKLAFLLPLRELAVEDRLRRIEESLYLHYTTHETNNSYS